MLCFIYLNTYSVFTLQQITIGCFAKDLFFQLGWVLLWQKICNHWFLRFLPNRHENGTVFADILISGKDFLLICCQKLFIKTFAQSRTENCCDLFLALLVPILNLFELILADIGIRLCCRGCTFDTRCIFAERYTVFYCCDSGKNIRIQYILVMERKRSTNVQPLFAGDDLLLLILILDSKYQLNELQILINDGVSASL